MEQKPMTDKMASQNPNVSATPKEHHKTISHKVGDAIERVGEKVSEMGAPKAGQKIYNTGNKIEHSSEKRK